jgi:hypothetical protein
MRVLTGDETGLLKAVGLEAHRIVVAGQQTRARSVKGMCWTRPGGGFAVAKADGVVTLWEDGRSVRGRRTSVVPGMHAACPDGYRRLPTHQRPSDAGNAPGSY